MLKSDLLGPSCVHVRLGIKQLVLHLTNQEMLLQVLERSLRRSGCTLCDDSCTLIFRIAY